MEIERDYYLKELVDRIDNQLIKIVTGIRRCGKSYLLNIIFKNYLIEQGNDGSPELEQSKDSDGIGANASKVISIRQRENNVLELGIKKQRNGAVGGVLKYMWDIDRGEFTNIPDYNDAQSKEKTERKVQEVKKQYKDKEDIF